MTADILAHCSMIASMGAESAGTTKIQDDRPENTRETSFTVGGMAPVLSSTPTAASMSAISTMEGVTKSLAGPNIKRGIHPQGI